MNKSQTHVEGFGQSLDRLSLNSAATESAMERCFSSELREELMVKVLTSTQQTVGTQYGSTG
jgi:hypothetical protein